MHCNVATFQKGNKKQEICKFRTFLSILQSIARDRQLQMVECDMDSWTHLQQFVLQRSKDCALPWDQAGLLAGVDGL